MKRMRHLIKDNEKKTEYNLVHCNPHHPDNYDSRFYLSKIRDIGTFLNSA